MPLPFEFAIEGPPVSQQTRRRARYHAWVNEVRTVSKRRWPSGELPVAEAVMLTITYFYEGASLDVDNIPKPISDALKGLVYFGDAQINDILCRRRDLNTDLRVVNPSAVLAEGFSWGREFLHIVVESAPNQEVIE